VLNELVTGLIRACSGRPCFRIYGRASYESDWRVIDIFATHRRDFTSRWALGGGTCIAWTSQVIAVGWDFASWIIRDERENPTERDRPVSVCGGRLRIAARRGAASLPTAAEILAHECGHTGQAQRLGGLYWPLVGAFTLCREGAHWWNHFENQASETGQFGGIVSGSVWAERFDPPLDSGRTME
jgi:hypothetical protein